MSGSESRRPKPTWAKLVSFVWELGARRCVSDNFVEAAGDGRGHKSKFGQVMVWCRTGQPYLTPKRLPRVRAMMSVESHIYYLRMVPDVALYKHPILHVVQHCSSKYLTWPHERAFTKHNGDTTKPFRGFRGGKCRHYLGRGFVRTAMSRAVRHSRSMLNFTLLQQLHVIFRLLVRSKPSNASAPNT